MKKFICIHGHFYQPPRENPWLESIEMQDSAHPHHDWNEKITAECYAPNSAARILNSSGNIENIINNYQQISFNFGPTLLSWIKQKYSELYEAIITADKISQQNFNGHGGAIAQAYNHIILPLANSRDKFTEIFWGIRDFELNFNRPPEGFWLPETAVDIESLEILARLGVKFVILAPHQAKRARKIGDKQWFDIQDANINTSIPYIHNLPSGDSITIFFYIGPAAQALAFGGLLQRGDDFANNLTSLFADNPHEAELVHIATDGETYGHHQKHGDMALAYALNFIRKNKSAEITIYGHFLEMFPPSFEVEIVENSSWSCIHGVERWKSNCGCNSGSHPDWQQNWREPLRAGLNYLRDSVTDIYAENTKKFLKDPWAARNDYIEVINNRSAPSLHQYLANHTHYELQTEEIIHLLKWLELERNALLMFTSCGWFFDEISGIETIQILEYAVRVIQLIKELTGNDNETKLLHFLEGAPSNISELQNGKVVYEFLAKPARANFRKVAAHYAIASLFNNYEEKTNIFCYQIERLNSKALEAGKVKLILGSISVLSHITSEIAAFDYGVIHYGDQNLYCGVRKNRGNDAYNHLEQETINTFPHGDMQQIIKLFEDNFERSDFSIRTIFRDEQRKVMNQILAAAINEAGAVLRQLSDNHGFMINFLTDLSIPIPKPLIIAIEYILNRDLKNALKEDSLDINKVNHLYFLMSQLKVNIDKIEIGFLFQFNLEKYSLCFIQNQEDINTLILLLDVTKFINMNQIDTNLWKTQNMIFNLLRSIQKQDSNQSQWHKYFYLLCENLKIEV